MKYFYLLSFLLLASGIKAQTITSLSVPKANSETSYYTALDADYYEISKKGNNQDWDIARISGGITTSTKYEDVALGQYKDLYPQANLFVSEAGSGEVYYISDDSGLRILGSPMESFLNPGVIEKGNLSVPIFEIKTPMNLGDQLNQTAFININIPISIIPDSILETLPIQPDSLRVMIENNYNYECSGKGTLKLPGRDFTALQQTATVTTVARLEAKVPFFGWQDVSSLVDFGLGLGEENTSTIISFWSPDHVGYIAQFEKNENTGEINPGKYTTDGTILDAKDGIKAPEFTIYPNPFTTSFSANIEGNLPDLEIQIIDNNGRVMMKKLFVSGETINTNELAAGSYTATITSQGNAVAINKLIRL